MILFWSVRYHKCLFLLKSDFVAFFSMLFSIYFVYNGSRCLYCSFFWGEAIFLLDKQKWGKHFSMGKYQCFGTASLCFYSGVNSTWFNIYLSWIILEIFCSCVYLFLWIENLLKFRMYYLPRIGRKFSEIREHSNA